MIERGYCACMIGAPVFLFLGSVLNLRPLMWIGVVMLSAVLLACCVAWAAHVWGLLFGGEVPRGWTGRERVRGIVPWLLNRPKK